MKKVLSLIVIVAAAAMVSCAGNTNKKAAETTEAAEATEQVATECCGECTQAEGECCKGDSTNAARLPLAPRPPKGSAATSNICFGMKGGCAKPPFLCRLFAFAVKKRIFVLNNVKSMIRLVADTCLLRTREGAVGSVCRNSPPRI